MSIPLSITFPVVEVPPVGYHGTIPSQGTFMVIWRTRFTLPNSTRSTRHPYPGLFDFPTYWHLYTHGTFRSHGFHGESLDYRHGTVLIRDTPVDFSLGPPFGDPNKGCWRGIDVCVVSWNIHLCQSHKVLVPLWVVTFGVLELGVTRVYLSDRNLDWLSHSKLLWSWHRGGVVCLEQ